MTTRLEFERPGRVSVNVDRSNGNYIWVSVLLESGRATKKQIHRIASAYGPASECQLVENTDGAWTLHVRHASFDMRTDDARRLQEAFAIKVRRAQPKPITTEAQPCHP